MKCCYCGSFVPSFEGEHGVRVGVCPVCGEGYRRRTDRAKRKEYEIAQLRPFEPYTCYRLPSDDEVDDYYVKAMGPNGCSSVYHKMYRETYAEAKAQAIELSRQIPDKWAFVEAHYTNLEFWKNGEYVRPRFYMGSYEFQGRQIDMLRIVPDGTTPSPVGAVKTYQEYTAEEVNKISYDRQKTIYEHNRAIRIAEIEREWS